MNEAERILAGRLLRRASDEFSNHGCNDMDSELLSWMSAFDRTVLETAFNKWNCPSGEDYIPFEHIGDASWMAYLAHRLLTS